MDERVISTVQADDLVLNDVIKVDGEFHLITGFGEDDGETITYLTTNLDGGDDDVALDPNDGEVDVYDLS